MLEAFPEKPKGMHWQTYNRLRCAHDRAEHRANIGLMQFLDRLRWQVALLMTPLRVALPPRFLQGR